ncbi:MAG: hypothetical protein N3B13_06475 [Deltaproteobacteria bacterium]|nr:hypothetical protein [Deltaproteobacteria bacterium]
MRISDFILISKRWWNIIVIRKGFVKMRFERILFFIVLLLFSCSDGKESSVDTAVDVIDIIQASDNNVSDISDVYEPVDTNDTGDSVISDYTEDIVAYDSGEITDTGPVNMLNIGLIMQLENRDILNSRTLFDNYVTKIDDFAKLFEEYGARVSFEAKEITEASVKYGSNILNNLIERGHSVNIHADSGTTYGMTFSDFVQELRDKKEYMEKLSVEPLGVSGICSTLDWVAASFNVGFKYITSITAFCLKSLPLEEQPDFVKNCLAPFDCQQAFPFETGTKLFLWRAKLGSDWRIDDAEGLMVLMPSFSRLACLDEEFKNPNKNIINCVFDNYDIERSLDIIDDSLNRFDKEKVNVILFIWSFGAEPESLLFEKWLGEIDYYVKKQKIRWRNTDEIFNEFAGQK